MNNEERYREALQRIVCVLGPDDGEECPSNGCDGCKYEAWEALRTATEALEGN